MIRTKEKKELNQWLRALELRIETDIFNDYGIKLRVKVTTPRQDANDLVKDS